MFVGTPFQGGYYTFMLEALCAYWAFLNSRGSGPRVSALSQGQYFAFGEARGQPLPKE